jgi:putative inorganic carbon (HCO3(-)) transporter
MVYFKTMSPQNKQQKIVHSFALNLFLIASVLVTPFYSFESINLPKFSALIFFASMAFIYLITNFKTTFLNLPNISKILIIGFLTTFILTFTLSDTPWEQQLYGRENRRNGLLTYLSLLLLFLIFHSLPYAKYLKVFINRIVLAGVFVTSYSILQLLGLDPFKWDSVNLHFFSTLGNPNFLSAYIAIVAIPILTWVYLKLGTTPSLVQKISVILILAILMYLIFRTISYQGFISLFASLSVFILITAYKMRNRILFFGIFLFVGLGSVLALIGTLNSGPLARILYKGSITSRGDFFRSAVNSGNSNLIGGTGFDSFGDYYLLYRDDVAGLRVNAEFTDSAHNYFLDLYATQGLFGLVFYTLLTLLTLKSFSKLIRSETSSIHTAVLFASWVAVQVQSLVSPTNFLFSILIFSISGFVIGSTSLNENVPKSGNDVLVLGLGCILALILSVSPVTRENRILTANQNSSPTEYIDALEIFPKSTVGYSRAINLFAQAGLEDKALEISRKAIQFNERTPAAHLIIFTSPLTSEAEKSVAYAALLKLDPMNPNLKNLQP